MSGIASRSIERARRHDAHQFVALAKAVGVEAIEVRNDIIGREFADGTEAAKIAHDPRSTAGLGLASINALQRFNDWDRNRAKEALTLVRYAAALGAPGIVLCPVIDAAHGWTESQLEEICGTRCACCGRSCSITALLAMSSRWE